MNEEAFASAVEGATESEARALARRPRPRLLLVDDEPHVLEGLALFLRRRFEIVARTNAAAALSALDDEGPFAAVVADLRMPGMNGVEMLAEVRRRSPSTSRVLLTGHGDVDAAAAAVNDAAVHRFLTKPCPPARLAAELELALAATAAEDASALGERMASLGRQATLGSMAGSIGHEMGNLVAALAGSVQLVREQVEHGELPSPDDIGLFDLVRLRLGEHVRHLRDLAQPRPGVVEDVDVTSLVCNVKALLDTAGILRGTRVELSLPDPAVRVRADPLLLEGVLINLLKNAAEALEARARATPVAELGELYPLIHVEARASDDRVCITVEDNGPGIAEEDVARLFDAYFTTKGADGTGLGLAIVRETIARQGGSVWVDSTLGVGTSFTVELPLAGARPLPPAGSRHLRLVR